MADAGGTFIGLPVALVAPIVLGCLGIVGSVTAALISRRKPSPAPAHVTVNYSSTSSRTAATALRGVSIVFVVVAVLLAGLFVYGRIARGAKAVQLVPLQAVTDVPEVSEFKECLGHSINYGVRNLIDG